jgi:hypothetical protein
MYRTISTSAAVAVAALVIVAGASGTTRAAGSPVACLYAMPTALVQAQVCGSAPYDTRSVAAARSTPVGCKYAIPHSRAEALACSSRDVNAPLSPAVLEGIQKANARIAATLPAAVVPEDLPISPDVRQAIYDANRRVSESVPTTASDSPTYLQEGLDPAIAESLRDQQQQRIDAASSSTLDPAIARAIQHEKDSVSSPPLLEGGVDSVAQQIRDSQAAARAAAASPVGSDSSFDWGSAGIGAAAGALLLIAAVGSGAIVRRRRPLLNA